MVVEKYQLIEELKEELKNGKRMKKLVLKLLERILYKQNSICYNMLIAIQTAIDLGNLIIEKKKL